MRALLIFGVALTLITAPELSAVETLAETSVSLESMLSPSDDTATDILMIATDYFLFNNAK
jgi:hypothetical protein